jgi:hypothetical protein
MDDERRPPLFVCEANGHARGAVPALLFDLVVDFESNPPHHSTNLLVLEPVFIKRIGVGRIEIKTERDTKGNAVLCHHQIFGLIDGMMGY